MEIEIERLIDNPCTCGNYEIETTYDEEDNEISMICTRCAKDQLIRKDFKN